MSKSFEEFKREVMECAEQEWSEVRSKVREDLVEEGFSGRQLFRAMQIIQQLKKNSAICYLTGYAEGLNLAAASIDSVIKDNEDHRELCTILAVISETLKEDLN